jgi:predicted phosphodiesterase
MPPILLLHLSDLHFGPHSRFLGEPPERLGKSFHRALEAAQEKLGIVQRVDLVVVTGDIAEAGKRSEFEAGRQFLTALAGGLGLPVERFVFVPGNHDVNWASCKKAEAELEENEEPPERLRSRLDEVKLDFYFDFLRQFYGAADMAEIGEPLARGARLCRFPDLRLAVAALDSREKESHRPGDHVGLVSRDQAESVLAALRRGNLAGWLKVIAVHHNPDVTTRNNLEAWRKFLLEKGTVTPDLLARYESDALGLEGRDHLKAVAADASVQLLLHGHHHAQDKLTWDWRERGHTHVLSAGSLWLDPKVLPKDEPASARLMVLDPEQEELRTSSLVYLAWHRVEGSVESGSFAADPSGWSKQRLDLPPGFISNEAVAAPAKSSLDTEFLRAFRQRLGDQSTRWDIGSLGALRPGGARGEEALLDDMYVELRFGQARDPAKPKEGKPLRAEELLGREKPLALRGVAGAGKTTWVRYTFGQLVQDERALPMMLVLRDIARHWQLPECAGEERSIDVALDDWIGSAMGSGWKGRLGPILKAAAGPRPILLVDGWDELGPLGGELRGKLLGFLREHPRVLAVVTSRPYGDQPPSNSDGFDLLDVQPLSDDDIALLTRRFFGRFGSGGEESSEHGENGFLAALQRSEEARDLARTPLLLTMMLLVGHSQPLPEKRHLLYEKCIDALLLARPEQKAAEGALVGRHVWCPPGIEERRRWAAALAHGVQTEGYKKSNRAPIVRSWDEMKGLLPQECPVERRDGFLAWLVETAGLLADRADGTLAFAHLSFQEYLTAYHLETTAEGTRERQAAFEDRLWDFNWWETLRLLAAQIEGRNPSFLASVLEGLSAPPPEGTAPAFVGAVLADGLGPSSIFHDWQEHWCRELSWQWLRGAEFCASAWREARREERKAFLARSIVNHSEDQTWLGWLRFEEFGRDWTEISTPILRPVSRAIIESLRSRKLGVDLVAAGRILCGGSPLWPSSHEETGLLQTWPSRRRLAGLRIQAAIAAGVSHTALVDLARQTFCSRSTEKDLARYFARYWARDLTNYWAHDLARNWPYDWARVLARDWARDWARDLARDLARDELPTRLATRINWARSLVPYLARVLAPDWARDWTSELALDWARYWARDWARSLGLDPKLGWTEDFAQTELCSLGRFGGRAVLASAAMELRGDPARLLSKACRFSLHPEVGTGAALQASKKMDPLWPALARHLARRSTAEDRELLIDLAQHPEKREPPLQWGLRFIVRGDLMLDDSSFLTLDELADEIGVERLPYLDEMEPELEVDWDAEDAEENAGAQEGTGSLPLR